MNTKTLYLFCFILPVLILLQACGPSGEITVVEDAPRTRPAVAEQEEEEEDEPEETFQEITIGVIDPVTNFDPLFADNLSTMRVISLIYDGLFTLDRSGEPVPVLAGNVEISEDGREYSITLNTEYIYHDNDAFTAGIGRRIHALDVKWAFERAATREVPNTAAQLLLNIVGYENYYLEQQSVFDSEKRVVEGVSGIQVFDPETVHFTLKEPDPAFLHKLASPLLAIYPLEGIEAGERGLKNQPIGTGPYTIRQIENDGRIILVKNGSEITQSRPGPDRIDIVYIENEEELFRQFEDQQIDWIPELGPYLVQQISDTGIRDPEHQRYVEHNASRVTSLYINPNSTANTDWLTEQLDLITEEEFTIPGIFTFRELPQSDTPNAEQPDSTYYVPYTDNLIARALLTDVHAHVLMPTSSSFTFFDIRVPIGETALYTSVSDSYHQPWFRTSSDLWMKAETPIISLHHNHLANVQPATVPWLLFVETIEVRDSDRAPS